MRLHYKGYKFELVASTIALLNKIFTHYVKIWHRSRKVKRKICGK